MRQHRPIPSLRPKPATGGDPCVASLSRRHDPAGASVRGCPDPIDARRSRHGRVAGAYPVQTARNAERHCELRRCRVGMPLADPALSAIAFLARLHDQAVLLVGEIFEARLRPGARSDGKVTAIAHEADRRAIGQATIGGLPVEIILVGQRIMARLAVGCGLDVEEQPFRPGPAPDPFVGGQRRAYIVRGRDRVWMLSVWLFSATVACICHHRSLLPVLYPPYLLCYWPLLSL